MNRGRRNALLWTLLSVSVFAGLTAVVIVYRANLGLSAGERAMQLGQWEVARKQLNRFLWLHPEDDRARMMIAEVLVKDESLDGQQAVDRAIEHLECVTDDSLLAATARMRQARIELLMLQHPGRAEALLRRSLELNADQLDSNYLMWKLLDLTSRGNWCEPNFWKVFDQTPQAQRASRLREWYMSQFYPGSANPTLNRMMGFLEEGQPDGVLVERFRLVVFLKDEPDRAVNYAAWAWWLHDDGNPKLALDVLEQGMQKLKQPQQNAFFVSVMLTVLFDLGRFDEMGRWMDLWPEPHSGFPYLRWKAVYLDEVEGEYAEALTQYERAIVIWPGPADWRIQSQMANCLSRMGRLDRAAAVRSRAKQIEELMDVEVHAHLRKVLGDLDNAERLEEIVEFYRKIDRPREADAWQAHVDALRNSSAQGSQRPL